MVLAGLRSLTEPRYLRVIEGGEGGVQAIRLSQDCYERRREPLARKCLFVGAR